MDQAVIQSSIDDTEWSEFVSIHVNGLVQHNTESHNHNVVFTTRDLVSSANTGKPSNFSSEPVSNIIYDQDADCSFSMSNRYHPISGKIVITELLPYFEPKSRTKLPSPASTSIGHANDHLDSLEISLRTRFEQATNALRSINNSKAPLANSHRSSYNSFRVNLPVAGKIAKRPCVKKQRLKRSTARACLLCRLLKLKCSPGRPCARCIEKRLGQGDLGFTRCLRDHPSKFNPFAAVPSGDKDFVNITQICLLASYIGFLSESPLLFVWAFSYMSHLTSVDSSQQGRYVEKPGVASFLRINQPRLSQFAFQQMEEALSTREGIQAKNYGRSLTIALSLYAWLGAARVGKQSIILSETEKFCKEYLSEYIDLLMSRCMPGFSGTSIRGLMWTMLDLMVFPAIPQLVGGHEAFGQIRRDAEMAAAHLRLMLSKATSISSSPCPEDHVAGEDFCKYYWPRWGRHQNNDDDDDDDGSKHIEALSPLFSTDNLDFMQWTLRSREPSFRNLNPSNDHVENENLPGTCTFPGSSRIKPWLEWMETVQMML